MIDIHFHIIFDVDDGPLTIDESVSLLEESYMQGVRTIKQKNKWNKVVHCSWVLF